MIMQTGTAEEVEKFGKRTLRVTKEHNEECKRLLRLMGEVALHGALAHLPSAQSLQVATEPLRVPRPGVPVVEAPCEAEATCAELCKHNKVCGAGPLPPRLRPHLVAVHYRRALAYMRCHIRWQGSREPFFPSFQTPPLLLQVYAAASEDMDTLTFNTPKLARNLMAPASADKPVLEIDTAKARALSGRAAGIWARRGEPCCAVGRRFVFPKQRRMRVPALRSAPVPPGSSGARGAWHHPGAVRRRLHPLWLRLLRLDSRCAGAVKSF